MRELTRQDNAWEFNVRELNRLGIEYEGKIVLALRVNLFDHGTISEKLCNVSINIFFKSAEQPIAVEKLVVNRPYPNDYVMAINKKIGRKTSKKYIPIIFDSFEQFSQVEKIEIIWKIPASADMLANIDQYVIIDYFITAEKPVQKGIYGLWTYEDSDFVEKGTDSVYDDFAVLRLTYDGLETVIADGAFDLENIRYSGLIETALKHIVSNEADIENAMKRIISGKAEENAGQKKDETLIVYYGTDVVLTDDQIVT